MTTQPLIHPSNRTNIGFNDPILRIYKIRNGGIFLLNKAACRLTGLSIGDVVNIHYTVEGFAFMKHSDPAEAYRLMGGEDGRVRAYITSKEFFNIMTWFKTDKTTIAFHLNKKVAGKYTGIEFGYLLQAAGSSV